LGEAKRRWPWECGQGYPHCLQGPRSVGVGSKVPERCSSLISRGHVPKRPGGTAGQGRQQGRCTQRREGNDMNLKSRASKQALAGGIGMLPSGVGGRADAHPQVGNEWFFQTDNVLLWVGGTQVARW
jgi:hypothetical protein